MAVSKLLFFSLFFALVFSTVWPDESIEADAQVLGSDAADSSALKIELDQLKFKIHDLGSCAYHTFALFKSKPFPKGSSHVPFSVYLEFVNFPSPCFWVLLLLKSIFDLYSRFLSTSELWLYRHIWNRRILLCVFTTWDMLVMDCYLLFFTYSSSSHFEFYIIIYRI